MSISDVLELTNLFEDEKVSSERLQKEADDLILKIALHQERLDVESIRHEQMHNRHNDIDADTDSLRVRLDVSSATIKQAAVDLDSYSKQKSFSERISSYLTARNDLLADVNVIQCEIVKMFERLRAGEEKLHAEDCIDKPPSSSKHGHQLLMQINKVEQSASETQSDITKKKEEIESIQAGLEEARKRIASAATALGEIDRKIVEAEQSLASHEKISLLETEKMTSWQTQTEENIVELKQMHIQLDAKLVDSKMEVNRLEKEKCTVEHTILQLLDEPQEVSDSCDVVVQPNDGDVAKETLVTIDGVENPNNAESTKNVIVDGEDGGSKDAVKLREEKKSNVLAAKRAVAQSLTDAISVERKRLDQYECDKERIESEMKQCEDAIISLGMRKGSLCQDLCYQWSRASRQGYLSNVAGTADCSSDASCLEKVPGDTGVDPAAANVSCTGSVAVLGSTESSSGASVSAAVAASVPPDTQEEWDTFLSGLQAPVIESMERVSIQNDISEVTRELVKLEKDIVFLENQLVLYRQFNVDETMEPLDTADVSLELSSASLTDKSSGVAENDSLKKSCIASETASGSVSELSCLCDQWAHVNSLKKTLVDEIKWLLSPDYAQAPQQNINPSVQSDECADTLSVPVPMAKRIVNLESTLSSLLSQRSTLQLTLDLAKERLLALKEEKTCLLRRKELHAEKLKEKDEKEEYLRTLKQQRVALLEEKEVKLKEKEKLVEKAEQLAQFNDQIRGMQFRFYKENETAKRLRDCRESKLHGHKEAIDNLQTLLVTEDCKFQAQFNAAERTYLASRVVLIQQLEQLTKDSYEGFDSKSPTATDLDGKKENFQNVGMSQRDKVLSDTTSKSKHTKLEQIASSQQKSKESTKELKKFGRAKKRIA